MSPYERAMEVYDKEPCARTFQEDLEWHLKYGYVVSNHSFFAMGRPVVSDAHPSLIVGQFVFNPLDCDCWHIYLLAGSIGRAWLALPYELPLISFERKNVLKFVEASTMRRVSNTVIKNEVTFISRRASARTANDAVV